MIAAVVAVALQLASARPASIAAARPASLTVRAEGAATTVALIETGQGMVLALQALAPVVPLRVHQDERGGFAVDVVGLHLDVVGEIPWVRVDGDAVPLASAPFVTHGQLFVPLQLVAEVLPRAAPSRLRYDAKRVELQVLGESRAPAPKPLAARAGGSTVHHAAAAHDAKRARHWRVVVDAGHGGPDHGMSGPIGTNWKIDEKDITLSVAKKLRAALESRGADVVMTRTTDTLIALSDRGSIANEQHGDVFVSIHVNAANLRWRHPAAARGFETYFLAEAKTEDAKRVERMENESIRFETSATAEKSDPLNFIINDMAQNEHLRESSELAELIQQRLGNIEPGPSRGVKQAGFRVLVTAYMPAVLVEIGFGTNPSEARWLRNASRQRQIASTIADATMEYLEHYQRRLGAAAP